MKSLVMRLVREEDGQDLIEYALLAAFISLVALVGITLLGTNLNLMFTGVANKVANATP
jgi:pilus assembly protein Flp/PilA